ncbi:hypothetical protein ASD99_21190 [Mesorhizobium sp. Root695]|uniref:hypothetical protein n=1 Tax=Mesorhizobium sp. Root695 TaxID=1736589 RepID=UPI000710458B|nr:hypothetical protein [Mesorhizobium sp. Root695]KRB30934.1 hypothetical protein ASD99_21190 [Mesorhizobium sp. Root695]
MNETSIWIHYARPRPHWYKLTADEKRAQATAWQAIAAQSARTGAETLGRYHIRGQHDFQTVEIWRFPSPEAAFDHWSRLTAAHYNEWYAFSNNIGLPMQQDVIMRV